MIPSSPIPRLLLIGNRFSRPEISSAIIQAVRAGVTWIQLRDHEIGDDQFQESAFGLIDRIWSVTPEALVSVNTRVQIASKLSSRTGPFTGVHLGKRGPSIQEVRQTMRADTPVGLSVHTLDEIRGGGIDYFLWSPVFPTKSKPGNRGTGISKLSEAVDRAHSISVIAMGGITPDKTAKCLSAGAYGIGVLSGILGAENIRERVENYLSVINKFYPATDLEVLSSGARELE